MYKLTVIIPVYNGEKHIVPVLEHLFLQDCSAFEVIVVDDSSSDNTVVLLRESFKDKIAEGRMKVVVLEKNGGPSAARNKGLELATTPYVTFLDSDDAYCDLSFFSKAIKSLEKEPDVLIYKYVVDHGYISVKKPYKPQKMEMTAAEAFSMMVNEQNPIWHFVWNKIYKLSVIKNNGLQFPAHLRSSEDIYFNEEFISKSQRVHFLDIYAYKYNCTNTSSLTSKREHKVHTDDDWVGYWNTKCGNYTRLKAHAEALNCWNDCKNTLMYGLCNQLIESSEHCTERANVLKMHESSLANEVKPLLSNVKRKRRIQKIKNIIRNMLRLLSHK